LAQLLGNYRARWITNPRRVAQSQTVRAATAADIGAFEFDRTFYPVTLANISTRAKVETGDSVLIGGFIISSTQPKKVILRAIGPSLTAFSVSGSQ